MNGLTAAKGLRRSVEQAGGTMRISVTALGDAFGRGKLTARAKTGIEQVLLRAGVAVEPSLPLVQPGDWVTLRLATAADEPPDPPRDLGFARLPTTIAAALTFALLALPVAAFLLPADDPAPEPAITRAAATIAAPAPAPAPRPSPIRLARAALADGEYYEAVRLAASVDRSLARPMRTRAAAALMFDAQLALARGDDAEALHLARRAARYGRAEGMRKLVERAKARLARRSRSG